MPHRASPQPYVPSTAPKVEQLRSEKARKEAEARTEGEIGRGPKRAKAAVILLGDPETPVFVPLDVRQREHPDSPARATHRLSW